MNPESIDALNGLQVKLNRARLLPESAFKRREIAAIEYAIRMVQFRQDSEERAFLADGGPEFLTKRDAR